MSIYEAVGMAWVIFTSALATVGILYLAFLGLKVTLDRAQENKESEVPVEVKEMFKIAR
jgi:threonine/homoserine/homoserine lactone efflux protein